MIMAMRLNLKLNRYSGPERTCYCFFYVGLVIFLVKQDVSEPYPTTEWCFISWFIVFERGCLDGGGKVKIRLCVWRGGFRLMPLLCCGAQDPGVVMQLDSTYRRVC
jgi:hypothetical protein